LFFDPVNISREKHAGVGRKLLKFLRRYLPKLQREMLGSIAASPRRSLRRESHPDKSPANQPLRVDKYAEDAVAATLSVPFPKLTVIGEESLKLDPAFQCLADKDGVFVLVDI